MDKDNNKLHELSKLIENVSNGVHLYRIRDALSRGHATVMIGAGFSLNASGGHRLLSWSGLVEGLLMDLYPNDEIRKQEASRFNGTSGSLRLAQEYEAVLGRAQLDARLHELLPDVGSTEPGQLHIRLLSLPWADVFTTNYDTLLERTLEVDRRKLTPSIQRRYQIVNASSDLPFSRSNGAPRIVKLHGTLNGGTPLIITEEDYRCYPKEHAPFVNMVQQSMLENVFCLLGFSGDDPNFIEWSGWTRDRLGPQAPPIYLITFKPVPEGQRLILEERKIFPIPIAALAPNAADASAYYGALNALLDFWHGQPPPRPEMWGADYRAINSIDDKPVERLIEWTRGARDLRLAYPGWLVAPEAIRERVANHCGTASAMFLYGRNSDSMSVKLRLAHLFELNWALEIALRPLTKAQAASYEAALFAAHGEDSSKPTSYGFTEELSYSDAESQLHWEWLAVALIRYLRETRDIQKFELWRAEYLRRAGSERDSETHRWICYEQVLFQIENLQFEEARVSLQTWDVSTDTADPYWLVRAGALFGELGDTERGRHLAKVGLHKIRTAIQAEGEKKGLVSREHWAEMILRAASNESQFQEWREKNWRRSTPSELPRSGAMEARTPMDGHLLSNAAVPPKDIPRQVQARESADHPEHQIELMVREFGRFAKILKEGLFDFDEPVAASPRHQIDVSEESLVAANAYVRMVEISGYVPRFGEMGLSGAAMVDAFTVLATTNHVEATIRVLLRAGSANRATTLAALTRENAARLTRETAATLVQRAFCLSDALLDNGPTSLSVAQTRQLIFATELVSRLLCRLDHSTALDALRRFLRWYDMPAVQHTSEFHEHFERYFRRVLRVLRPEDVAPFLPILLALKPEPVALRQFSQWPRIVQELLDRIPVDTSQGEWPTVARNILVDAKNAKEEESVMSFHLGRLDWLHSNNLLDFRQRRAFAALVWRGTAKGKLPATVPGFYHGALLKWPSPKNLNKQNIFKSWLLAERLPDIVDRIVENGETRRSLSSRRETLLMNLLITRNVEAEFAWTSSEALIALENIRAWWKREGSELVEEEVAAGDDGFTRSLLLRRMRLIGHVCQRILCLNVSRADAGAASIPDWLAEMWVASWRLNSPMPPFLFAALYWWPDRALAVIHLTKECMASPSQENFSLALQAAGHWLIRSRQPSPASQQFISTLVDIVGLRLDGRLDAVLAAICELLTLRIVEHFRQYADALFSTLHGLLEDLQGHEFDTGFVDVESRPQLRERTAKALSLLGRSFPELRGEGWQRCLQLAAADPLAEVRNVVPLH